MRRRIQLTNHRWATVDDEDFKYLTRKGKWYARKESGKWFAARSHYRRGVKFTHRMHTLIMARILGHSRFRSVRHRDGNKLNNRRSNLQPVL